jgi:hypothetical protein
MRMGWFLLAVVALVATLAYGSLLGRYQISALLKVIPLRFTALIGGRAMSRYARVTSVGTTKTKPSELLGAGATERLVVLEDWQ